MIILECILDRKKLRIRFHSFINNEDGKVYLNVYNNDYNCQFPTDIRENGCFYEIGDNDIHLISDGIRSPFYKITKRNIRILTNEERKKYQKPDNTGLGIDISNLKIYDISECVVCLSETSSMIFIPCAHRCVCEACYEGIKKVKNCCPLCRRNITHVIKNNNNSC
jgi:hypothetical protein